MNLLKIAFLLSVTLLFLVSCVIKPEPFVYGKDACTFCKMNIVDNQHATQFITKKGKVFKYDSIECMVRDLKTKNKNDIAQYVITDYSAPGIFANALEATYLISKNIKSPMGENLSGFQSKETAMDIQREKEGTLYTWDELTSKF